MFWVFVHTWTGISIHPITFRSQPGQNLEVGGIAKGPPARTWNCNLFFQVAKKGEFVWSGVGPLFGYTKQRKQLYPDLVQLELLMHFFLSRMWLELMVLRLCPSWGERL